MRERLMDLGCSSEKVAVHHLGVDLDSISFEPRTWDRSIPLKILIAATFREKKGIPFALEALAEVRKSIPIQVTLIGDASNDPEDQREKSKILNLIERHKLDDTIRMLGFQPHQRLFQEAYQHHVFLSPSIEAANGDTEGGAPVSLIEMAATGMVIVSTTHCDIPEVLPPAAAAILAPERSVKHLVDAFLSLREKWPEYFSRMHSTRKHLESGFSGRRQGVLLTERYCRLAGMIPS